MLTRSSQQLNAVPHQTIINNMYRIANIVLFVLAIFVVMGCSCSKTLCERNIQDDILNIDKFRKQSKKEYRYIEEDAKRLFANSAAVYSDTLYRQQYTSLQGYFYGETKGEGIAVARKYQLQNQEMIKPNEQDKISFGCEDDETCVTSQQTSDSFFVR